MDQAKPKKSLGQHWLNDPASLAAMCDAVEVGRKDMVLEIGPGQGALTKVLLKRAKQVIAVELDDQLAQTLQGQALQNLEVVHEDILQFDFTKLPAGYKVVANIPYYLTSNLVKVLSQSDNPPLAAALLVQKEVAQRAAASPGQMSVLAVLAQYYWQVSLGRVVKAGAFTPPPKVDSQILILSRRDAPLFEKVDDKQFFRLVKAGFSQKRKTLENSLSGGLAISKIEASELLQKAGIAPTTRAQTLNLEAWHQLYVGYYSA